MTGKDLIIYILQNGLENEPVIKDGRIIGFMSTVDAAIKFGVGVHTIYAWIGQGRLDCVIYNGTFLIPANSELRGLDEYETEKENE